MRALIIALILGMGAVPFLFGARQFASSRNEQCCSATSGPLIPGTSDQWLDFARTIAGTLIGAGLAFGANLHLQRRARRIDQIAAANAAGATLARQYNSFANVRNLVAAEHALKAQVAPNTPMWFFARPFLHHLRDDLEIDFDKLTFIFEIGDVETFQKLHSAQACYDATLGYLDRLEQLCIEKQQRFEAAGFVMHDLEIAPQRAVEVAGPRLIGQLEPVIAEIERQCAENGPRYIEASHALHRAVARRFGSGIRVIRIVE